MRANPILPALATLAVLGLAPAARAEPATDRDTIMARLFAAQLDLDSEAGARAVLGRIQGVARSLCGGEPAGHTPADRQRFTACVTSTVERAVVMLRSPRVASLYRAEREPDPFAEAQR